MTAVATQSEITDQPEQPTGDALELTLPGRLLTMARERGDKPALRDKKLGVWKEISWREYYDYSARVGRMLWHMGIRPGDHVAILSENRPEWLYADLGAEGIGARSVGIYQTNPAEDVAYVLEHSDSKLVFCEDQEQVDKVIEVADQTESVRHVVVFDPRGTRDYTDSRLMSFADFLKKGRALLAKDPEWFAHQIAERDPDEVSMIVYTSGTTGPPKGAMLTPRNALETSRGMVPMLDVDDNDAILSYLPLCHVAEKIFTFFLPLTAGCVVHFGESVYTVQQDLKEVSPTVFLGVPRIWEKVHAGVTVKIKDSTRLKRFLYSRCVAIGHHVAEQRRQDKMRPWHHLLYFLCWLLVFRGLRERLGLGACRIPVTGAAPVSADLLRWFHAIGVPVLEGYGQTECAGVCHVNRPGRAKLGTVGEPLPNVEQKIADDGEILVRGSLVFTGYLHNEDATATTIDDDGWLHTGDIGEIDEDGYLKITGRKKEIIITAGGKNLSPEKIENALKMSPYIKEVVAVGDERKFISALIQIDAATVGDWATRQKIPYTSFEDLTEKEQVRELVEEEIKEANDRLARVETVRAFRLFPKELHQDDGEVTATQKVKRSAVAEKYSDLIESMY